MALFTITASLGPLPKLRYLEKIVLIKIPTEVYPALYKMFVYLFAEAGVKNIMVNKEINFEKMYNERNNN